MYSLDTYATQFIVVVFCFCCFLWTIACFEIVVFLCSSSIKNTTEVQAKQSGQLWGMYWKLLQSYDLKRNRFYVFAMRVEHWFTCSQKAAVRSWRYYHYCTVGIKINFPFAFPTTVRL